MAVLFWDNWRMTRDPKGILGAPAETSGVPPGQSVAGFRRATRLSTYIFIHQHLNPHSSIDGLSQLTAAQVDAFYTVLALQLAMGASGFERG